MGVTYVVGNDESVLCTTVHKPHEDVSLARPRASGDWIPVNASGSPTRLDSPIYLPLLKYRANPHSVEIAEYRSRHRVCSIADRTTQIAPR